MITIKQYEKALKIVQEYESQKRLKYDLWSLRAGQKLQLVKDPDTKKGQLTKGNIYIVDIEWLQHPCCFAIRDNYGKLKRISRTNMNNRWICV